MVSSSLPGVFNKVFMHIDLDVLLEHITHKLRGWDGDDLEKLYNDHISTDRHLVFKGGDCYELYIQKKHKEDVVNGR